MLGYVKIFKPQLKVCEYDTYKAVYCTLCKRIGKKYGLLFRWTLSYDFAFLAMLKISVSDSVCSYYKKRCTTNPFKKCNYCKGNEDAFDFASGVSVIMMYFSIIDKIADEKGIKRLFYKLFKLLVNKKFKKATLEFPNIYDIVKTYSDSQFEVEKQNLTLDEYCEPTSTVLSKIFECLLEGENEKRILNRVGYCVGKWIYLADALDDLEKDVKTNSFNPLKDKNVDDIVGTLNVCSTDAGLSYELLNCKIYNTIINNIFYLGMPNVIKNILKERDETK